MKHLLFAALLGGASVMACTPAAALPRAQSAALSGADIAPILEASGLPVDGVRVLDATTDQNALLGRPGQYTGKVDWFDARVATRDGLTEATLEVFPDAASLANREKYVSAIANSGPLFAQYIYRNNERLVLLRLPHQLTPDQAAEYQAWLGAL